MRLPSGIRIELGYHRYGTINVMRSRITSNKEAYILSKMQGCRILEKSAANAIRVLAGLKDTDGHITRFNGRVPHEATRITTKTCLRIHDFSAENLMLL